MCSVRRSHPTLNLDPTQVRTRSHDAREKFTVPVHFSQPRPRRDRRPPSPYQSHLTCQLQSTAPASTLAAHVGAEAACCGAELGYAAFAALSLAVLASTFFSGPLAWSVLTTCTLFGVAMRHVRRARIAVPLRTADFSEVGLILDTHVHGQGVHLKTVKKSRAAAARGEGRRSWWRKGGQRRLRGGRRRRPRTHEQPRPRKASLPRRRPQLEQRSQPLPSADSFAAPPRRAAGT